MPLYKFVGNKILTWCKTAPACALSEFHSGYRLYSPTPSHVPFDRNSNDFHFDTEIIIQLLTGQAENSRTADPDLLRRRDLPRQRDQVRVQCYCRDVQGPLQELGLFYDRRLRLCVPLARTAVHAEVRPPSTHTLALARSRAGIPGFSISAAQAAIMGRRSEQRLLRDRRRRLSAGGRPASMSSISGT